MSNSSQPENSFETLTISNIDDIIKDCTIDLSGTGASMSDITITSSTSYTPSVTLNSGLSTYTIGPLTSDTITLTGIDTSHYIFNIPEEWENTFPDWHRVKNMCDKYPGLKIAFDNFRLFYEMVKDDYDNPTPKK